MIAPRKGDSSITPTQPVAARTSSLVMMAWTMPTAAIAIDSRRMSSDQ